MRDTEWVLYAKEPFGAPDPRCRSQFADGYRWTIEKTAKSQSKQIFGSTLKGGKRPARIKPHAYLQLAHQMLQVNIETVIMFGDVASSVRKAFDQNGTVGCSLICETEDGERVIFEAAGTLGHRAVAMNTMRKLFRRLKVARYVRVTRCWTGYTDVSIHPTENANCREGIMILSVDNTSVRMRSIAEIKGGADGKVALGRWEPIEISDGWRRGLVEVVRGCCG